jgi:cellulose synthase/poly-beta-1,6-N-acetylglucosamine synthase-like glycosyltransferase
MKPLLSRNLSNTGRLITLLLWFAGFLLLGCLRPCAVVNMSRPSTSVSVIIPARNEEHNLPTLLRSLATQPLKLHEVIVVDDGSHCGIGQATQGEGHPITTNAERLGRQDVGLPPGSAGRNGGTPAIRGR